MAAESISKEEEKRLKDLGYITNKGTDCFSARVLTGYGRLSADTLRALADAAERYGNGTLISTTRLTIEIPGIPYEKTDAFREEIERIGLETGGTGPKVRPVVSCKGTTCRFGLIDTFALAEEIHRRFYQGWHHVVLPHKFKIAVGGCPNRCVKPDLNDIGIMGWRGGYRVFLGGRWGKKQSVAQPMSTVFQTQEEVLAIIEKAILFYRENGEKGERFSETIARLGFENVEAALMGDEILARKEQILNRAL